MSEIPKGQSHLQARLSQIFQPGLSLKQRIRYIPFVGYSFAWANTLLRLPSIRLQIADLQRQVQTLSQQGAETLCALKTIEVQQAERSKRLSMRLDNYDALDIGKRLMQLDQLQLARQMKSIRLLMAGHQEREDAALARLVQIEEVLGNSSRKLNDNVDLNLRAVQMAPDERPSTKSDTENDRFYLEFEALFRGQPADIKQRLQVYLPYLSHISSQAKKDRMTVIDVGCGRGEWLELLDENEIPAIGVDMNAAMVDACLARGLAARCADAIAVLREQKEGSVGAVTGFHIIEHLPFEQLLALFDAALHALCPGGVIIFETPNPENLKVGACNFYFDPTHLHPIVPQVAEFMARQRGFAHAEILRLHPYPDNHLLQGGSAVEALLNKELFGPQDYAVIGRK
ncbi:MAG: methyltransferase domain-containing protein [Pseudomonadota bacterium]